MLSDKERREMKAMAASAAVRGEFEQLRAATRRPFAQPTDVDWLLDFLTTMSRLSVPPQSPRPFVAYARVRL